MPEMRYFTKEEQKKYTEAINKIYKPVESEKEKLLSKHILELQADKGRLTDRVRELEAQIEKMKCCSNCKFGYKCSLFSTQIHKENGVEYQTQARWNKEKEKYCNVGYSGKYECWEIKEK